MPPSPRWTSIEQKDRWTVIRKYSMLDRGLEAEQLPYCKSNNIAMLAYSPLAQGLLTGKVSVERELAEDDLRALNSRFAPAGRERILAFLEKDQAGSRLTGSPWPSWPLPGRWPSRD